MLFWRSHLLFRRLHLLFRRAHLLFRRAHLLFWRAHLLFWRLHSLEAHNTLLSNLEESRETMNQMDRGLSELSERMLSAVATVYGKNSMEYSKAGGSQYGSVKG
ncbi:hypothetical protein [Nostoc sp.]|uniref:hypothetical protein n=1 Tax=Nostoc sp. TaxID=1180 RepID=UPI002FF9F77B